MAATPPRAGALLGGARYALRDRRTQLAGLGIGLTLLLVWVAFGIATGDAKLVALGLGLVAAPFLLALAFFRPYVFPYGLFIVLQPFENLFGGGPAGSGIRLLGAVSTAAVLILIVRNRRLSPPPLTVGIMALYVLWALLSAMWAVDMGAALADAQTLFSLLAMYTVMASAPVEERDIKGIAVAIVASGLLAALYGIWYFHQFQPTTDGRLAIEVGGRAVDSNQFADALMAPFALTLVALLHARRPHTVLATLAVLAIVCGGVVVSLSREAMFGCLAVVAVVILMSRRRLVGLAFAVPSLGAVVALVPSIIDRFVSAADTGGAGRTSIWQVDLHAWAAHPIIGWGAGSAFQAYNANLLSTAPRIFAGWSRPPHNMPLHALVDFGIVGFVLLAAAFCLTFWQLRAIRRDDPLYDLRVGLTASLVAIGVVSFFIDNATDKYVWVVICAIAQLRMVARSRVRPAVSEIVYEPPPAFVPRVRRFAR